VHYRCDEENGWEPDLEHIRSLITPRTKAIVVINPNNPTGAVYRREVLEGLADIAREHDQIGHFVRHPRKRGVGQRSVAVSRNVLHSDMSKRFNGGEQVPSEQFQCPARASRRFLA